MKLKENAQINRAYLSLGSNLGDKSANLNKAIELLKERAGEVLAVSSFYETAPDGFESENSFVNIALSLDTKLDVYVLLDVCEEIERELGRTTKSVNLNYSDRLIDIDILYFNNMQLATERLTLPHPRMHKRQFVLEPLAEIAPKLRHPITGMSTAKMLKELGVRN
jgi:2-amino-4-hydroxy-6-hydroxymethyldihydropteridine diphosphokinase